MFGSDQRWSKVIRKHNSGNMCDVCSRRCLTHFVFVAYNSNHIPNMFCHVLPRHALNVNESEDLRSIGRQAESYSGTWITSFQYCSLKMSITLMERNGDSRYSQHCSIWCFHRPGILTALQLLQHATATDFFLPRLWQCAQDCLKQSTYIIPKVGRNRVRSHPPITGASIQRQQKIECCFPRASKRQKMTKAPNNAVWV